MFDKYFNPPSNVVLPVQIAATPRAVDIAGSPSSTTIDLDAPSTSSSSTNQQQQSPIISYGVEEPIPNAHFNDPCHEPLHDVSTSQESSSDDHPLANVIGNPSRSISTRKQLETDAMWCYFYAFLTFIEPKNFKEAMLESTWIDVMQEEIHEFKRLQVWELLPCPDKVMLIKLKWIFKVKTDEFGGDNPSHVYKLKKAFYGVKQAPRAWYDMLSSFLISQHFSKGAVDPTLFTRKAGNDLLLAKPTKKHLFTVKWIFKFLKRTIHMGLWQQYETLCLNGYTTRTMRNLVLDDLRRIMYMKKNDQKALILLNYNNMSTQPVLGFTTLKLFTCKLFSRGNSSTQQWEHFFTSSGKITLAVGTQQWE
nr:hypothetical protein [Tanacetum cinerariifolium]GEW91537.1 hypothetical protein [Tanacetum cinerariifolium]